MNQNLKVQIHKIICIGTSFVNLVQIQFFMVIFGALLSSLTKKIFNVDILQKYYPYCLNMLLYVNGLNLVYELPLEVDLMNEQYIFMCSHASFLDAIAVYKILGQILITISKEILFKIPVLNKAISYWGAVPINRNNLESAIQSYQNAKQIAQKRQLSFLIFPEGQRRRKNSTGEFNIQPLKKGPFHLAKQMQKDIVVVNIVGSKRLLNGVSYRPGNLFLKFNKPIKFNEIKDLSITEMQDKIYETFRENHFVKTDKDIYHVDYDRWFFYFLLWIFYEYCIFKIFMYVLSFIFQLNLFQQLLNNLFNNLQKLFLIFLLILQFK